MGEDEVSSGLFQDLENQIDFRGIVVHASCQRSDVSKQNQSRSRSRWLLSWTSGESVTRATPLVVQALVRQIVYWAT